MTNTKEKTELSLWAVYGICLFISSIFFFLFGFNSPIYIFNSDPDYQWFMTMGNGLVHGKIPYRDLFEQKGPIVYFVTAFCCLFPTPRLVMLILEIICMSLFFFFAYRICRKYLNTFYSLTALPILAFAVFTCWCRLFSAATIEEFCLPIYTYFLLCWLEFLQEKRSWNWIRSLCLGLCFGIILWVKYTLIYFMLVPMLIWFILSIYRKQVRIIVLNALSMLAGILIISAPIVLFYALQQALDDLFYVYFFVNLTAYKPNGSDVHLKTFQLFFGIGPAILILILVGITFFSIRYWRHTGWLLLTAFIVNLISIVYTSNKSIYYYGQLAPYAVFGAICLLKWFNRKFTPSHKRKLIYTGLVIICLAISFPLSTLVTKELGRNKEAYTPLVVADVIHNYAKENNLETTLLCYKTHEYGFYNTTNIVPNNYFFVRNVIEENRFPLMYTEFENYIIKQTSNFVIVHDYIWNQEEDFLSQYYHPYTGNIESSTYQYYKLNYNKHIKLNLVLLVKNI